MKKKVLNRNSMVNVPFPYITRSMQQRIVTINNTVHYYRRAIAIFLNDGKALNPQTAVTLFAQLFRDYAVQEIGPTHGIDDVLLFRYGTFDEGDELGPYFGIDLVRRRTVSGESFQLSCTLRYDPAPFDGLAPDEIRSWMGPGDWVDHIADNEGYLLALEQEMKTFTINLSPR